ncbi:MAG: hypothetical protein D6772_03200 [Bacteroidetes bacterium]|nr:MAG: hypothetical protein D6772_03200 [Bacteroidota bacterium]
MSKRTALYVTVCFLLGVLAWAWEASHYHQYLDLQSLLRTSLWLSGAFWLLTLLLVRGWWYRPDLESWQRIQRAMVLAFVAILIVPPLFSASNRWGTAQWARPAAVVFEQEDARYQSRFGSADIDLKTQAPTQYLLFFYHNNQLCRIGYEEGPKFADRSRGDTLYLPISPGRWSYAWIPMEKLDL